MYGVKKIHQSGTQEAVTKEEVKLCFVGVQHVDSDNIIYGTNDEDEAETVRDIIARNINHGKTFDEITSVVVYEFS